MNLKIIKFIKTNNNWKDLLQNKPYCLSIIEDNSYYLLKYNMIESDFHEDIVKECRGLIIKKIDLEPVALSFRKFHNVQEIEYADNIDWSSARVQEKIDGSKILCWFDDDKWHLSTSGTLNAYAANIGDTGLNFGSLFEEALNNNGYKNLEDFTNHLLKHYCYTFELISPKNRVVVDYPKTDLYIIGKRSVIDLDIDGEVILERFTEYFISDDESTILGIKKPKEFSLTTLNDCMEAANNLGSDQEGFVVVDKYWNRVKIKSPLYVIAHFTRNNNTQTRTRLLEVIENNTIDDFISICPEWKNDIDKLYNQRELSLSIMRDAYVEMLSNILLSSQKDYALWIIDNYKNIQSFLFYAKKETDMYGYIGYNTAIEIVNKYYNNLTITKKLDLIDKIS